MATPPSPEPDSPYVLLCPGPCVACSASTTTIGVCDPACVACWSQNPLDPGRHVFEIVSRNRFGTPGGSYFTDVAPMGLQVRAYSLREALHVASMVPFHRWFPEER